ncbi:hypothetical protein [Ekhidna sp.]|uniref:hypothetical protein n=1 Tax=Ekhidna sp. TaxID=2608089 RepID=UPI003B5AB5C7
MSDLIQERKKIIESWNTTWNINKTSKTGPMGFRYAFPFLAFIIILGFAIINYAMLNEFFELTEKFRWNNTAFFGAMMISLIFNAHHRIHLKSFLYEHYNELDSKSFNLTEESNQRLKSLINFDKRPIHIILMILGVLIMLVGFLAHLGDYFLIWHYTWPAVLIFEVLYFFNANMYLKAFRNMKTALG